MKTILIALALVPAVAGTLVLGAGLALATISECANQWLVIEDEDYPAAARPRPDRGQA